MPTVPSLMFIIARQHANSQHANSKQKFPVISSDFFFSLLLIRTNKAKTLCSQLIVFAFRLVYDDDVPIYVHFSTRKERE